MQTIQRDPDRETRLANYLEWWAHLSLPDRADAISQWEEGTEGEPELAAALAELKDGQPKRWFELEVELDIETENRLRQDVKLEAEERGISEAEVIVESHLHAIAIWREAVQEATNEKDTEYAQYELDQAVQDLERLIGG